MDFFSGHVHRYGGILHAFIYKKKNLSTWKRTGKGTLNQQTTVKAFYAWFTPKAELSIRK